MELRASDADREATVDRLRVAAMEGRISSEELEARIQSAYSSQFCSELSRLTEDVTPPPPPAVTVGRPEFVQSSTRSVNPFAIASLVCAVAWFLWLGSFMAVIFGHVALRQIKNDGGRQSGKGLAIAGLAVGYLAIAVLALAAIVDILD